MGQPGTVQSVDRAAQVLEIIARDGESSVGRIGRELEVHGSTASRLLASLAAHDLVERLEATGTVRLGVGVLRLAAATRSRLDLTAQAGPVCDALAEELGETVNVAVYRDGAAINVYQAQGTSTVAMHNWIGDRTVLHATSSGKMLLAHLEQDAIEDLLASPLERFTEHTITGATVLREQLQQARENGWAQVVEEYEDGLNAVAAPIRGPAGDVVAALSVAGPTYRLAPGSLPATARVLLRAADEISRRIGYRADVTG
ncbi:IclR family transcriptional regulator [Brachybacterium sp. 107]|uniref:IclR family transcriptional regulator n=1 Tax=Brachybacterium sp. 107 TaxID=3457736 RepID=UPI004034BA2A